MPELRKLNRIQQSEIQMDGMSNPEIGKMNQVRQDDVRIVGVPVNRIVYKEGGGVKLPDGGNTGDLLAKHSDENGDVEWITPANNAEKDNTRPITAAAVYTEIGNINALLATI